MANRVYTEEELDRFVYFAETLSEEERTSIEQYLANNALAQEYVKKAQEMKRDIAERLQQPIDDISIEFSDRLFEKKQLFLPPVSIAKRDSQEIFVKFTEKPALLQRIYSYMRFYPVRSASFVVVFAGLLFFGALSVKNWMTKDINPTYAEVKNDVLRVYNQNGEILWTKPAVGMLAGNTRDGFLHPISLVSEQTAILIADVTGDENNEILITGNWTRNDVNDSFSKNYLYCFDAKGALLWKRDYPENAYSEVVPRSKHDGWLIRRFFTFKDGEKRRLFVVAHNEILSPAKLVEVNPLNGEPMQTYWNMGHLSHAFAHKFSDTGKTYIIIAGISGYDRAFVAQLDADNFNGSAPSVERFMLKNLPSPPGLKFLEFARTPIAEKFDNIPHGWIGDIIFTAHNIIVYHTELGGLSSNSAKTVYTLGPNLEILLLTFDEGYNKKAKDLLREGKITTPLNGDMLKELTEHAMYWDGTKLVPYQEYWHYNRPFFPYP